MTMRTQYGKRRSPRLAETSRWKCIECGCTDTTPCPGGCAWVRPNLCSACADNIQRRIASCEQTARS